VPSSGSSEAGAHTRTSPAPSVRSACRSERATRVIKNLQFVRLDGRWWISALAWDDERPGLAIPDRP
jgi:hypothetical protein